MKLILSRKGFDSAYGGVPSPILPDGTLCPLPIPSNEAPCLKGEKDGRKDMQCKPSRYRAERTTGI
jgi:Nucleotide modification associated domain 3